MLLKSSLLTLTCRPGVCTGATALEQNVTVNAAACGNLCLANDDCEWYSYSRRDDQCQLFLECPNFDESGCSGQPCLSSQRHCTNPGEI